MDVRQRPKLRVLEQRAKLRRWRTSINHFPLFTLSWQAASFEVASSAYYYSRWHFAFGATSS